MGALLGLGSLALQCGFAVSLPPLRKRRRGLKDQREWLPKEIESGAV